MSNYVHKVYAIDASNEIIRDVNFPKNFEMLILDGTSIPVPENSINIAYSSNLMEHLHPQDAFEQLQNIFRALKPKGVYNCITPNRAQTGQSLALSWRFSLHQCPLL